MLGDDRNEVIDAIMRYINDKFPWACMPFPGGSRGCCYIVFKGQPKSMVGMVLRHIAKAAVTPRKQNPVVTDPEVLNPDDEATLQTMMGMFQKFGSEYPMFSISPIDMEGRWELTTGIIVHYNGSVVLDYAEPDFFDKLDPLIEHIINHDGLLGFSLQPRNGA